MSEYVKCVFCNRIIPVNEYFYRLPVDYSPFVDEIHKNFLSIREVTGENVNLPPCCWDQDTRIVKSIMEDGRKISFDSTGRRIEKRICPTCHNEIFKATDTSATCSTVFFGMKKSGKTTLIMSLVDETTKLGFDLADDKYCCIFNNKIYNNELFSRISEKTASQASPADLRKPVVLHRAPAVRSGLKHMTDVFHDVSVSDKTSDATIIMKLPFSVDADHFVFCIEISDIFKALGADNEQYDMMVRDEFYKMITAAKYSEIKPVLHVVMTKADLAVNAGSGSEEIVITNNAHNEVLLKNYFSTAYPLTSDLFGEFTDVKFSVVSALDPSLGVEGMNSVTELYFKLTEKVSIEDYSHIFR